MPLVQLPIFPLPLVLFPGAPQLLHIFEPRYREMLSDCMAGERRFGISWAEPAPGVDPEPAPGTVGCIAHVRGLTALPEGRSNILTVGEERYTLLEYVSTDRPYRVARVETFDDEPGSSDGTEELAQRVGEEFRRVSAALGALRDSTSPVTDIATGAQALSFQVAAALEIDPRVKQELLVVRSVRRRLELLERLLRAAEAALTPRAEIHVRARRNGKGGPHAAIAGGQ